MVSNKTGLFSALQSYHKVLIVIEVHVLGECGENLVMSNYDSNTNSVTTQTDNQRKAMLLKLVMS